MISKPFYVFKLNLLWLLLCKIPNKFNKLLSGFIHNKNDKDLEVYRLLGQVIDGCCEAYFALIYARPDLVYVLAAYMRVFV